MKNLNQTAKFMIFFVVIGLTFASCSNEETLEVTPQEQDATEVARSSEIGEAEVLMGDLIIESYEAQESIESGRVPQQRSIPECATLTVVIEQGFREVTVDFGNEGCMVRGHLLKG